MAIDQVPEEKVLDMYPESSHSRGQFMLILPVLMALIVGEVYAIHKINSTREALEAEQAQTRQQLAAEFQDQLASRLSAVQNANAQQFGALKEELDSAAKRLGATGGGLKRARAKVAQLQKEQEQQTEQLQQELARKADQQQVGALDQDVSAQRTDLDNAKKALETVRSDLGLTRAKWAHLSPATTMTSSNSAKWGNAITTSSRQPGKLWRAWPGSA